MAVQYYVQYEALAYINHIPQVPKTFTVNPDLLGNLDETQFAQTFAQFANLMKEMYQDLQTRPQAYGMPLDERAQNMNHELSPVAKAAWRDMKRLGDLIAVIGTLGKIEGDHLNLSATEFKAAVKKIKKCSLLIDRLIDFDFVFHNYDGKFTKDFSVSFAKDDKMMHVVKAYALAPAIDEHDHHGFYYFDYKRVADQAKLPEHAFVRDLAALVSEEIGELCMQLHVYFVENMKLSWQYKDDSIEYFHKKKRLARFCIDFHKPDVVVICKLKNMDAYIEHVDALPPTLRKYFENGGCRYCGFQGATQEHCKFRVSWTLDGKKHDACGFGCFNFANPQPQDAQPIAQLMSLEYGLPAR